ncbi:ionotropic receptor 25a [Microplitis mediator]|uniref:ionotropic receptor 25a n=1 Tax=Microplitis mediator TaxID=375433 RepID=UPI002553306F|nr:ionotropic receptor 25a [Microplitis mediator]
MGIMGNWFWWNYIFLTNFLTVFAQQNQQPTAIRPVNLFIINDEENSLANNSVKNALMGIKDKTVLGNVIVVQINGSDPKGSLDKVCAAWDPAVRDGGPGVPDLVLDTTRSGFGAEAINSFTASIGVPTFSSQFGQKNDLRPWNDLTPDQKNYLVQIMPPADLIPDAIRQLCSQMNITNAAIIFDKGFVMDHKYKSLLLNIPTRHVIVQSKIDTNEILNQLQRLRDLDIVNFFVLGEEVTLKSYLDAAEMKNFTGRKYGWYAFTMNEKLDLKCDCRNMSVVFFKPMLTTSNQKNLNTLTNQGLLPTPWLASAFYYDFVRVGVEAIRSAIKNNKWPNEPYHITCDEFNGTNTPVRNLDLLPHLREATTNGFEPTFAGFYWGNSNGEHHAEFDMLIQMVVIENGNVVSADNLGTWKADIESPLNLTDSESKVAKHTAVTSFRIVTVRIAPFIDINATGHWEGYCIDLINEVQKIMNFEYEIYESPDNNFGTMDENGKWDGMIKELIDKRADIALGTLSVMAERENVVDFTVPYYDLVGISILMKKKKEETSLFNFLTVLNQTVWLCILGAYFFTSLLMWIFDRWSPYSYQNNKEKYKDDEEKRVFHLKECLWFCMTSLTPQGGGEAPKNLSGRLVAATWWLFGFIIIASYTANLAAYLTVARLEQPIESLDDLSKQYKVQYSPINPSEAYTYFKRMADIEERFYEIWKDMSLDDSMSEIERAKLAVWDYPVSDKFTKMFQQMQEAGFPKNREEAIGRVRKEIPAYNNTDFAFIGDATEIRYLEMTTCDLIMIGDEFSRKPYAMAVQQGSPLKDQLNNAILKLLNQRKLETFKSKWWSRNPYRVDCTKKDSQSDGISIQNIGGAFIVIFVGILLACCTLAFEYWYYRYRPRAQAKKLKKLNSKNGGGNKISSQRVKPTRFNLKPARKAFEDSGTEFRARF